MMRLISPLLVVSALFFATPANARTDCAVVGDLGALVAAATIVMENGNAPPRGALEHVAQNGIRFDTASIRYAMGPAVGSGDLSLLTGFADLMDTSSALVRTGATDAALDQLLRNRDMISRASAALQRISPLCPDLPPLPSILDNSSGWSPQSATAAGLSAFGIILAGGVIVARLIANRAKRNRRYFCKIAITADIDGAFVPAELVDISQTGAKLTGPVGQVANLPKVMLRLPVGAVPARPIWSTAHACGVKFQRTLTQKELTALLGKTPVVRERTRHKPQELEA